MMRRCVICGSDEISPYLSDTIGFLYQCNDCQYIGPLAIEADAREGVEDQFVASEDLLTGGTFWSETGIANKMLFSS